MAFITITIIKIHRCYTLSETIKQKEEVPTLLFDEQ
jgi:hypothetical protein